ncbi:MAG: hypothetical protein ABEK04_01365, partial [Candidatus Nanohalobium sp.]
WPSRNAVIAWSMLAASVGRMPEVAGIVLAGQRIAQGRFLSFFSIAGTLFFLGYLGSRYEERIVEVSHGLKDFLAQVLP